MSSGYDPQYYLYSNRLPGAKIKGLAAFNVDTMVQKQTEKQLKVNLYHVSCLDEDMKGFTERVLELIWKSMHCSSVRLSLYHYEHEGKLQVDAQLKNAFKALGFKWKTVTNDNRTGSRVEILECNNVNFKAQISPLTCTLYRKGLAREDVHKEPLTFKVQAFLAISDRKPDQQEAKQMHDHSNVESVIGLLNGIMQFKIDNFIKSEISILNPNSANHADFIKVLHRAESLNRGNFLMPDSFSQSCMTIDDAVKDLRSLITIDHLDKQSLIHCSQFIGSSSLYCLRFASLDSANLREHSYIRIKHNPISFTSSIDFEHIIVLPNTEENMNFVVLLPRHGSVISNSTVRDTI